MNLKKYFVIYTQGKNYCLKIRRFERFEITNCHFGNAVGTSLLNQDVRVVKYQFDSTAIE